MAIGDRLVPWIAAERTFRAVLLVGVGVVLLTHLHADWASAVRRTAQSLGLDPAKTGISRLAAKAGALRPTKLEEYGLIAIGYGALEGAEGYGLWRRRRWGEYLTVVATALLIIPEVWEIAKKPTLLKVAALVVNVAIVVYLVRRLRAHARVAT